jgi:hypothetical protein
MNILIDIGHPGHVHFFRHAAGIWAKRGHLVRFTARRKDVTLQLLQAYRLPYDCLSTAQSGIAGLAFEMLEHQYKLIRTIRNFQPDVMLSIGGTFMAHIAKLMKVPTIIFSDTEAASLSNRITFPFATHVCTPACFEQELGKKHTRYNGYQELAYLHPKQFKPNKQALQELGLQPGEIFFLLRFVSWGEAHDIGKGGFSDADKLELVQKLNRFGRVLISSEGELPQTLQPFMEEINPSRMHDLLYYAHLYIGEGATMAAESAILGTPSIYVNPLKAGTISELSDRYQLLEQFYTVKPAIEKAIQLAQTENIKSVQNKNLEVLLTEKINVTAWLVVFVEEVIKK